VEHPEEHGAYWAPFFQELERRVTDADAVPMTADQWEAFDRAVNERRQA
jgi:hypothetical protein